MALRVPLSCNFQSKVSLVILCLAVGCCVSFCFSNSVNGWLMKKRRGDFLGRTEAAVCPRKTTANCRLRLAAHRDHPEGGQMARRQAQRERRPWLRGG